MRNVIDETAKLETAIENLAQSVSKLIDRKAKAIDHPADGLRLRVYAHLLQQEAESVED
jgi:hypothetical protein